MNTEDSDIVVIGGGPAGYVAAMRAAQHGNSVVLIEKDQVGGTCLNRGCIPSKALLHHAHIFRDVCSAARFGINTGKVEFDYRYMVERKDTTVSQIRTNLEQLILKKKVHILRGIGKLEDPYTVKVVGQENRFLKAKKIILATGSEPKGFPLLPFDHKQVHDSTSFLNNTQLPQKLLIIGGGVIGCECASLYAAFGVEVTIIEALPHILSAEGPFIGETLQKAFSKQGIRVITSAMVSGAEKQGKEIAVILDDGRSFTADQVLVSIGRVLNTEGLGLEKAGIVTHQGAIIVNESLQTNHPHIYAIGDITAKWLLAHVASHQGLVAADHASGYDCAIEYKAIPSVIFTDPEIATVGYTLERALEKGYDAKIAKFPFFALGKTQAIAATEGFAQVVVSQSTGEILGAQVVGLDASNLIAEMVLAIENELTIQSVANTVHAHPTIAEVWMEAAMLALNKPLHLSEVKKQ